MSTFDLEIQNGGPRSPADFEARVILDISRQALAARDEDAREGIRRAILRERVARGRRAIVWATAASAIIAAGLAGWFLGRGNAPANMGDGYAFDGGASGEVPAVPGVPGGAEIERDPRGRIAEIRRVVDGGYDGERLIFRSGRLIRTEQWQKGKLDGVAVDYDAEGRVVETRTWVDGVERGPWVRFDAQGKVEASGVR